MATLTGSTIASTYAGLLSVTGAISTSGVEVVQDGAGTDTSLWLADERATIKLGTSSGDDFVVLRGSTEILKVEGDTDDVTLLDDLILISDSSVIKLGAGADFTITHDGTTGATLAGNPITITSGGAATWSTSAGALIVDSAASTLTLDGHTGVTVQSSNSGEVDITSAAAVDINATTTVDIDGTAISVDGTDDSNITITGSNKDLTLSVAGGSTQTLTISSAGTGADAIGISASAGGVTVGLGGGAGDDFIVDTTTLVVESDNNRVGIGTATPDATLHVAGGDVANAEYDQYAVAVIEHAEARLELVSGNDGHASGIILSSVVGANDINQWVIQGRGTAGTPDNSFAIGYNDAQAGGTDAFTVADTNEILTITTAGNVGIGTDAPDQLLHLLSSGNTSIKIDSSNGTGDTELRFASDDVVKWSLKNEGSNDNIMVYDFGDSSIAVSMATTATAWAPGSDERIKEDVKNIGSTLDAINELRPITYQRKYAKSDTVHPGLIAQEVLPKFPLLVYGTEESFEEVPQKDAVLDDDGNVLEEAMRLTYKGGLSIAYSNFVPYLIKAIQELSASNDALKARIEVLEG